MAFNMFINLCLLNVLLKTVMTPLTVINILNLLEVFHILILKMYEHL